MKNHTHRLCASGSGQRVKSRSAIFARGGDAKLKSLLMQVHSSDLPISCVPSEAISNFRSIGFLHLPQYSHLATVVRRAARLTRTMAAAA